MVATAVIGAGVLGAGASIFGGMEQKSAANQATNTQQGMFQQVEASLLPYSQMGQNAFGTLYQKTPQLTQPFNMTQAQLEKWPGYQFTLNEGLKSVQNSYAAQGLGTSGAALKGAAAYTTGLADQTFQNAFNDYWSQNQNIASMYGGQAQLGEAAAAGVGTAAGTFGANIGSTQLAAGNALAGAGMGVANNLGSGLIGGAFYGSPYGQTALASQYGMPVNNALMTGGGGWNPQYSATPTSWGGVA